MVIALLELEYEYFFMHTTLTHVDNVFRSCTDCEKIEDYAYS